MTTTTSIEKTSDVRLSELGHSAEVSELASLESGVALVSGKHGSGKSVTLAAIAHEVAATRTGNVLEIVADAETEDLGIPKFVISDRPYKKLAKNPKREDVEAARRYSILTTASILQAGPTAVVFDDIRHSEAALIATYLAEAGVLVLASIHNTGEAANAVKNFVELPGKVCTTAVDSCVVEAVVHQSLNRDGDVPVLTSAVYRP